LLALQLRDSSGVEAAARQLSGAAADSSLLRPLPGLDLPPPLPDKLTRSPTLITTLPNGIRVASEDVPVTLTSLTPHRAAGQRRSPLTLFVLRGQGPSACIGVFVDSGSVYETKETTGVTHLLEKLAFKDTAHRSHLQVVEELEIAGGNVRATAAREQMVYSYDTLKAYMPVAVELLLDCVRNPLFPQDEVDRQVLDAGLDRYSESLTQVNLL
jgi:mitochondrial-processing peptidase subunit alpha